MSPSAWASLFNTVTETIDRPPARVWDLFHDRSLWMESFHTRELVSGVDGERGSVARVHAAMDGRVSPRMEEIVHAEPGRRLVVRLWADGANMGAHADFQFEPAGEGCRLRVSIHTWLLGAQPDQARALEATTQGKVARDFARLRAVAEGAPR